MARRFDVRAPVFFSESRWRTEAELMQAMVLRTPRDAATIFYACIVLGRAAYVIRAVGALDRHYLAFL